MKIAPCASPSRSAVAASLPGSRADLVVDGLAVEVAPLGREGALPGEDVQVVAVDERAVDVEQDGFDGHGAASDRAAGMFRDGGAVTPFRVGQARCR